ncbi:formylglycine-generating enzyme family protein [Humibacter antri]
MEHEVRCCAPSREQTDARGRAVSEPMRHRHANTYPPGRHEIAQALIPSGAFLMGDVNGDENRADGETPAHLVAMDAFEIDVTAVTNADFGRFVDDTGYRTEAEEFGFSAVFHLAVQAHASDIISRADSTPWWWGVRGADWRHPGGSRSELGGLHDHPVVHISWNDANAYCAWAGRRLPTEAEWERASRGGLEGHRYPWGDELTEHDGSWRANIWQGRFPLSNTLDDGFLTTAPVRSFAPNGYGLWQTVGNVWEWCSDRYSPNYYAHSPDANPRGPEGGETRVLRGGSYLCHESYCNRYRNSARSSNTPDSSMGNAGFRTAGAVVID